MVHRLMKMDYAAMAKAAVDFNKDLDDKIKAQGMNMNHHHSKLYELVLTRACMMDEEVYSFIYNHKIVMEKDKDGSKLHAFFSDKDEAKRLRDLVNDRLRKREVTSKKRHPDNWTHLVCIQPGPDNHRYTGTFG